MLRSRIWKPGPQRSDAGADAATPGVQGSFDLDSGGLIAGVDEQLNEQDYLAGCLYGLSDNANANHPTR